MNTPKVALRRHNNPELRAKYAQKKGPTKAQRKLAARQEDFENNLAKINGQNGYKFTKPGSNK